MQPQGPGSYVNHIGIWGIIGDYNFGAYQTTFGLDISMPTKIYNWSLIDRGISYLYFAELWLSDEIQEKVDNSGNTYWKFSIYAQKMMVSRAIDNASYESHEASLALPAGSTLYKNEFIAKFRKWIKRFMGVGYGNIINSYYPGLVNVTYTLDRSLCE